MIGLFICLDQNRKIGIYLATCWFPWKRGCKVVSALPTEGLRAEKRNQHARTFSGRQAPSSKK